jgi:hypothetical protein
MKTSYKILIIGLIMVTIVIFAIVPVSAVEQNQINLKLKNVGNYGTQIIDLQQNGLNNVIAVKVKNTALSTQQQVSLYQIGVSNLFQVKNLNTGDSSLQIISGVQSGSNNNAIIKNINTGTSSTQSINIIQISPTPIPTEIPIPIETLS